MGKMKATTMQGDGGQRREADRDRRGQGRRASTDKAAGGHGAGCDRSAGGRVFGRDDSGKAHASWFGEADAERAIKAAGLMNFKVLPITSDEHRAAASAVAAGRVFASGRAFSPRFCREAACAALEAFSEAYAPPAPVDPEPQPAAIATSVARTWAEIGAGALVLAAETPTEPWYPAIVSEAKGEGLFVLQWRDFPDEPAFVRRADDLGLLPRAPVPACCR